jgi:isopenicillin N synthase-like dioxygenase
VTLDELKKSGKIRAGAHSDYGTVTLLLQKPGFGQNGLRALNADKNWVRVNPPDYCMVVNLGDLFQHWTNDVLKSTIHKVEVDDEIIEKLQKGELTTAPERQTIVLFCDPDKN